MKGKILVTDSLFIFDEHVRQLKAAGYEIERLDKPKASEEELCEALKGKVGYILGGVEKVTDKVIESADSLKAIVFTGADYAGFIPGHKLATKKGGNPTQLVQIHVKGGQSWTCTNSSKYQARHRCAST